MSNDKNDFSLVLASSVHDMKNSVGMLLNSLESLIDSYPVQNEAQARSFATLEYEASRINTELIQLLAVYRMDNGRLPINIEEHYLIDQLEEQVARNDMLLRTRNLEIQIDCDENLIWYFDAELVGGVIHNILVNGARYSKKSMSLKAEVINDELVITVADDGTGYPKFMLENLQQSFDQSVSFREGNTHLGLYFAQQIASMHFRAKRHGRIELTNGEPLGGGAFRIYLP